MKFSICSALIAFASVASAQALYSNKTTTLGPILHEHSTTLLEVPTGVSISSDKDRTSTVTLLTTITLDHPHAVPVTRNSTDVSKATSMGTNTTPTQVYSTSTSTSVSVETITPSTGAPYTTATTVETPVLYASCPPEKTVTVTEYATTQFVTVTYTPSASVSFNPSSTAYYGNNTVTY